jgi:hypothetical protein
MPDGEPARNVNMTEAWTWPDGLDAVVAAPAHHRVLLENDRVRVLETRIEPGDIVPVHTHRWPCVYHVMSWSDFVRRDADGKVMVDSRSAAPAPPPEALWSGPLPPHSLENVGATAIHLVSIELKEPALETRDAGSEHGARRR